jgi:outer membrane beta-barrel protein
MNVKAMRRCLFVVVGLLAVPALAQETIEKVVVRNRLYDMAGKKELGLNVGFTLVTRLTDHNNITAGFAYNISDTLGFELRAGYALGPWGRNPLSSHHTGLADQVADRFMEKTSKTTANDLSNLWAMWGNAVIGARWAPFYGKLSLMAEVPVHFQFYLWLGAGAAMFERESLVICNNASGTTCNQFYEEDKIGPLGSAALGFRFFLAQKHGLKLEIRDYSYPDSFLDNVNRAAALNPATPTGNGTPNPNPGITNVVQVDLGYSFVF